jgi:hypothetical protein
MNPKGCSISHKVQLDQLHRAINVDGKSLEYSVGGFIVCMIWIYGWLRYHQVAAFTSYHLQNKLFR